MTTMIKTNKKRNCESYNTQNTHPILPMDTDSTNKDINPLSTPNENDLDQPRKSFGFPNRQLSETSSPLTQDNSFSVSSLMQDRQNSNMTPPILMSRASNSNGLPLHMLESTGSNFSEARKDSGVNEEEVKMRKVSTTPFIKTVMADAEVVDATGFSMYNWIELQAILKSNYFVVKNEAESKRKIEKKINEMISKYNQLFTKIRENNERIRKTLDKEPIVEDEVIKVMNPNHEDLLGDADIFVKKLLYLIHDRPRVLATLVKGSPELSSLKAFEETLCTTFYEDIIADDVCDDDLIRLLAELLELDFEKANRFAELFYTEHFTNKMLASYLKRNECRRYVKSILKNPLLSIMKETAKIRLDPIEIERQLKRGGPRRHDVNTENRVRQRTSATMNDMVEKKKPVHHANPNSSEENSSNYTTPKFRERRPRGETTAVNASPPKGEEEKAQEMNTSGKKPGMALERIQNPDVIAALQTNFTLVKKYLSVLIQSIFDNVYSMPIGLRILCKILYILAKKRFPNAKEKEYNEVLGNFIFRKWISPNFISPEHNGIINDFQTNDEIIFNLAEIAKVLQAVFNQNTFDPNDIKSELNEYISELRPSVEEYYKELMAVNEDLVKQIRSGSRTSPDKIKSLSICISLQEIRLLAEGISKQKEKLASISPEIVNLSEKILFYNRENNQFGDKVDPETKIKVKPTHCFTLFKELIYPEHLVTNYLEEFNKMQGFSKTLPDDQKFLLQVKHLLKNFLINIEDIKNIVRLSKDGKITFDDVLEKYEDKLYANESKQMASKEKPPTHISALFLISMLKELDPSYTSNNYYKLYQEIFQDFKTIASKLDFSISSIKLQLLRAYDALNRNYVSLKEVNEKKKKAIKKAMVRDFIKQTKIHLCITSPSTARTLGNSYKAPNSKKGGMIPGSDKPLPDKIELNIRDEKGCIHERFAIIRELAASGGMLGNISGRGYSQSISDRKPSMLGDGGEDIFNENNYHSNTIDEFIQIFGNIKEVKDVMETGEDKFGVKDAITKYYNQVRAEADKIFKGNSPDENDMIMDEIEEYICKRLYNKIYPPTETAADTRFWSLCKRLDWVTFSHLEIIQKNRRVAMWQYAAKVLNEIDNRITPLEKLDCMMECVKTIAQVLDLAATKEGGGGADETLPIMLYVVLKACPKRIHSNLNFIGILRDSKKMESGEGFCYTQVLLAVTKLEEANAEFFKMTHEEFIQAIKEKEKEFNLPEIENVIL